MQHHHRGYIRVLAPFCVLVIFLLLTLTASHKPVVIVHGLFDSPSDFQQLLEFINETHPGTNVTVVDLFDRTESLKPLWMQVEGFRHAIYPIMQNAVDGVHLICYSQGGLICRALLSTMPNHSVHTFISLSSPQMGQYGDFFLKEEVSESTGGPPYPRIRYPRFQLSTDCGDPPGFYFFLNTKYLKWLFPQHMKSNLYRLCYTQLGQDFSICNYWNDPHHRDLYLNNSNFLALLNDERQNPNATAWKKNLLRIRKLVLIGGPDDGVIMPWQSSMFAFYDCNETVREMRSQLVYIRDTFGLKTLDARGDIVFCPMPGVAHTNWHSNRTVYDTCIAKWLT